MANKLCNPPEVSVIMPVYNREKYLAEAIESVLCQTFRDIELIIVDDGSSDRSVEIATAYESYDDRVRCVKLNRNSGVSTARNRGLEVATGEYVAFMDSDDVSLPERLRAQVDFLKRNSEIGAVGIRSKIMTEDLSRLIAMKSGPPLHPNIVFALCMSRVSIIGGAIMVRTRLARKAGGWDERLRVGEEAPFFIRLLKHGARFANVNEVLYLQRTHKGIKTRSRKAMAARKNYTFKFRFLSELLESDDIGMLRRFERLRNREKLDWFDRRLVKRDSRLLIARVIERGYVRPEEEEILLADMNSQLEQASPRLWQMFCHWRRARGLATQRGPCEK
jgi:glycosyltransferase involved in cell wall biosynthesis